MVSQQIPTKAELLDALRRSGDEVAAKLDTLDESTLSQGRYENGWNAKQILAHMASIEWAYPRLIDLARQAPAPSAGSAPRLDTSASQAAGGAGTPQINDYNERQVAKRADASKDELVAEFKKNRAALIEAVQAAEDDLFSREILSAGGVRGPLAGALQFVAVDHVRGHLRDLMGEPGA